MITEGVYLRVTAALIPAFYFNKNDNIHSELRISYGDEFWALQDVLGKTAEYPIEIDDD